MPIVDRLLHKIESAALDCADSHWHITVAGEKNNRQSGLSLRKMLLELEAIHAGHPDVEDKTTGDSGPMPLQKEIRRRKCFHFKTRGTQHHRQRIAHGFIVVDHEYRAFVCALHASPPGIFK